MRVLFRVLASIVTIAIICEAQTTATSVLRIGIASLVHGHVAGFLKGALKRTDIQIVGIAEKDKELFDRYAKEYNLSPSLYFSSLDEMLSQAHPAAVVAYTNTSDHRRVVEDCARRGVHVMMEKPLAVSYKDALAMQEAAHGKIHVLVNYETTWYASNKAAYDLLEQGRLGALRRIVVRDGHEGPKEIHVQPEFLQWLTNPQLNGAGALFDFGCYGADLSTWLHKGAIPQSVTAITEQIKPAIYPNVDDDATVLLRYHDGVAVLEPSWNWPSSIKDMQVYGRTGSVRTIQSNQIELRTGGETSGAVQTAPPLAPPYDDSLRYFAAVIAGTVEDRGSLSSLDTNMIVTEILDAARTSAREGRTVKLPLND